MERFTFVIVIVFAVMLLGFTCYALFSPPCYDDEDIYEHRDDDDEEE
jgi:hypothetical protein